MEWGLCLDEAYEHFLVVVAFVEFNFVFTGEPAEGSANFFLFEFGDFLELLHAEDVSLIECVPNETGPCANSVCVHRSKNVLLDKYAFSLIFKSLQSYKFFMNFLHFPI